MKNLTIIFVFSILFFSCAPKENILKKKSQLSSSVKILVVNSGHALNSKSPISKFADWVKKSECDILFIQQIEQPKSGQGGFNAVRSLAKNLDWNYYFGNARYYEGFDSGNAIFSLFPVMQTTTQDLPVSKGRVRRSLAFGVIDVGVTSLSCVSVEFDEELKAERILQANNLKSFLKKYDDNLFLVCGSFYTNKTELAFKNLSDNFKSDNENLSNVIRIFTSNSPKIEIESVKYLKSPLNNDGLLAVIKILQ